MNGLLILTWLLPLLAAPFALKPASRWPVVLAPLPALLAALWVPSGSQLEITWLLLGSQFGFDAVARVFLLFSALLWLFAAQQTGPSLRDDPLAGRFRLFFLLAMAGNFWLIVAQDMVNFYLGFALMGLAAYGLVIHDGKPASLRAGRVYLAMTLVAETALFAALLLIFQHTESLAPRPAQLIGLSDWAIGLLVFGLGIKAGLVLLHVWLPLAHPAAPIPASAVLSGTMIKAALIGWLRFLPLGQELLWGWGQLLVGLGSVTLLYAIPVGLLQTNPKVVLAYSSVSKMGLMTAILGLALLQPALAPAILTAVVFYAAQHGLAKGALFLGVGVSRTSNAAWVLPALALPALVLAGAPFTAGALSKVLLEPPLAALQGLWADLFPILLILSTLGTTLLMGRFLTLMRAERSAGSNAVSGMALPWLMLIGTILIMPFLTSFDFPSIAGSWPLAVGIMLLLLMALLRIQWARQLAGSIPAGDILEPVVRVTLGSWQWLTHTISWGLTWMNRRIPALLQRLPAQPLVRSLSIEHSLSLWPVSGILALLTGVALLLLMWTP